MSVKPLKSSATPRFRQFTFKPQVDARSAVPPTTVAANVPIAQPFEVKGLGTEQMRGSPVRTEGTAHSTRILAHATGKVHDSVFGDEPF
jgi:hypothetical protein